MKKLLLSLAILLTCAVAIAQKPAKGTDKCKYTSPIPDDMDKEVRACNNLYLDGKYNECIMKYDTLILKFPDYCVAFYNRGLAKYYKGDKAGAKPDFEKALSLGHTDAKELMERLYEK